MEQVYYFRYRIRPDLVELIQVCFFCAVVGVDRYLGILNHPLLNLHEANALFYWIKDICRKNVSGISICIVRIEVSKSIYEGTVVRMNKKIR